MFQSIWEDLKMQYRAGNMVTRIILVNLAFFVGIMLIKLTLSIAIDHSFPSTTYENYLAPFLELPSDFVKMLTRPWTLFTHMFMHYGLFHFIFNMLWLYWFGRIVGDLIGDRKVLPIYLLSGLASAALFMLVAFFDTAFAIGGSAIGASGAVFGLTIAAAAVAPDYIIRLLFLGNVRLKYIALAAILLQLVALTANSNAGGTFGHIGGIFMGYFFVVQLRRGNDLSRPVNRISDKISGLFSGASRRKPKVVYRNPGRTQTRRTNLRDVNKKNSPESMSDEAKLDIILEKIKSKGMQSLSEEEKEFLLKASKK